MPIKLSNELSSTIHIYWRLLLTSFSTSYDLIIGGGSQVEHLQRSPQQLHLDPPHLGRLLRRGRGQRQLFRRHTAASGLEELFQFLCKTGND